MPDHERFTQFWTQAQPTVTGYISSMVANFHEAEDLLQSVAIILLRKFSEYDASRPFVAWALGIAKLEILSLRRSHARNFLSYHPDVIDAVESAYEAMSPELNARAAAIRECLKQVKADALEVLKLRYEESLKPGEIAPRLGRTAGTVRVMLSRIRVALLACVERRIGVKGAEA